MSESYLPWMRLIAKQVQLDGCVGMEEDDLIGYGYIGLKRAFEMFDEGRGVKFKTYAEHKVRSAMMDAARKWREVRRSDNSKRVIGSIDSCSPRVRESLGQCESEPIEPQLDMLYSLLSFLEPAENESIFMRYWQGMKLGEIGRVLGCNKFVVYKSIQSGLAKLRVMAAQRYRDDK